MKVAQKLPNDMAHATTFTASDEEARQFAMKVQKIDGWIERLQALIQSKAEA
jgi:hypothetical protein